MNKLAEKQSNEWNVGDVVMRICGAIFLTLAIVLFLFPGFFTRL